MKEGKPASQMNRFDIRQEEDLTQLTRLPEDVTEVTITGLFDRFNRVRLPLLPAHVTKLTLRSLVLEEPIVFAEGLQELSMTEVKSERSMREWHFPRSLQQFTMRQFNGEFDLRTVTAVSITLQHMREAAKVLLPESLDELKISRSQLAAITKIEVPPHLRSLTLDYTLGGSNGLTWRVNPSVKELTISGYPDRVALPIGETWPNVECLVLDNYFPTVMPSLELDHLGELTLMGRLSENKLSIQAPRLETLIVSGNRGYGDADLSDPANGLGETIVTMVLDSVTAFPAAYDWERLESLTVRGSEIELPQIRWLEELTVDRPLMTNGYYVGNIDEYKQAWGASRSKRPSRPSETAGRSSSRSPEAVRTIEF